MNKLIILIASISIKAKLSITTTTYNIQDTMHLVNIIVNGNQGAMRATKNINFFKS